MTHFPDHMSAVESRICNKILTRALEAGYSIQVRCGEDADVFVRWTRDRAEIQRETAATGSTLYELGKHIPGNAGIARLGTVVLIHGNEEDVFSDMTAPNDEKLDELEKLMHGIG